MEIHWNGFLGCLPLPEHLLRTINNCTNAHCSIVLPFSSNNYTSETPGKFIFEQSLVAFHSNPSTDLLPADNRRTANYRYDAEKTK